MDGGVAVRGTERPRHVGAHGGDGPDHPAAVLPRDGPGGFRFEVMTAREVAAPTVGEPAATVAASEAELDPVRHPPGPPPARSATRPVRHPPGPTDTRPGETVVHAEDIRRPLGITHAHPPRALTRCADLHLRLDVLIGGGCRAAGLRLRAADTSWTAGDGPEVVGPMPSLLPSRHGPSGGPRRALWGRPAGARLPAPGPVPARGGGVPRQHPSVTAPLCAPAPVD
ncbi:hypothetical protein ACFQ1I_16485 [Kitasatospora arboriphila]